MMGVIIAATPAVQRDNYPVHDRTEIHAGTISVGDILHTSDCESQMLVIAHSEAMPDEYVVLAWTTDSERWFPTLDQSTIRPSAGWAFHLAPVLWEARIPYNRGLTNRCIYDQRIPGQPCACGCDRMFGIQCYHIEMSPYMTVERCTVWTPFAKDDYDGFSVNCSLHKSNSGFVMCPCPCGCANSELPTHLRLLDQMEAGVVEFDRYNMSKVCKACNTGDHYVAEEKFE